jgi:hypothetical protein
LKKFMLARTVVYCSVEIMQTLTSAPSVAVIGSKKDGGDDNNVDDENEPVEIRGKKKKANRGAPMRVTWYFCIIPQFKRWFTTRKDAKSYVGMRKAERSLRKKVNLGTPQMHHKGVTLITTFRCLTKT